VNCHCFGRITAIWLLWRKKYPCVGLAGSAAAAIIDKFLFLQNMASFKQWNPVHGIATGIAGDCKVPAPDLFCALVLRATIRSVLAISAPGPQKNDGWFISSGALADG
jgi:hypothetical protein